MTKKILALIISFLIPFSFLSSVNATVKVFSDTTQSSKNLGQLIYDVDGIKIYKKITARYYTDNYGIRHDLPLDYNMDKYLKTPSINSNDETKVMLNSSNYKGEAIQIAGLNNKNGAVPSTLTYKRSHTYKCEKSVEGNVDWKLVEASAGVRWENSYTEEIDVSLNVPVGKAINLWLAPEGITYNFNIYHQGPPIKVIGWGTWTNITKLQVTPVAY